MKSAIILTAAALFTTAIAAAPPASQWKIGPVIRGKVYSVGMPATPRSTRDGWSFNFPEPDRAAGHVHYVTYDPGSLTGATRIVVRYRIEVAPGTRFVPQESPEETAGVSLFLQRAGDNWSARGAYDVYRWYAPPATVQPLRPGVHQMVVRLDDPDWGSVMGQSAGANPRAFRDALADASRLGLVFGSPSGRGHGVFATDQARFILLGFDVIRGGG